MTIKEIAQIAGVSISTVSKIVNNKDDGINIETRNRVLKIVKDYNYTPYGAVKNTSDARTFLFGLLLNGSAQNIHFINGVMKAAQKNGYSILLYDSSFNPEQEIKNITALCHHKVDGVIWEPIGLKSLAYAKLFENDEIEICYINTFDKPGYFINFTQIGYQAAKLLLDYGHTDIGCLTKAGDRRSALMLDGLKKCLFDNGIAFTDKMNLSIDKTDWYMELSSHTPTGIISSHYTHTLELMEQLAKIHFRLPYDLSLISLNDGADEGIRFAGLSTLKVPHLEFGEFVCEQLISHCEKTSDSMQEFKADYVLENNLSLGSPFSYNTQKIIVIGSINIDVTLNVKELPLPGQTISTDRHSIAPGGKGANQAVGVAKLGKEVALIGKVGYDYDSTVIYSCMKENHVDAQGILRNPNIETGKAYIHVPTDGESMITILSGANQNLSANDILAFSYLFKNAVYCLLQTEIPIYTVTRAAELAHQYGVKTILKPAAINTISTNLMQHIDIFVPNRKEAGILCPNITSVENQARHFIQMGAGTVIITLGHHGCYVNSPEFTGYLPPANFTAVDTTGAADAFIAALAVYLSSGYKIEKAVRIANYAAGFCVARQGVIPALIDRNSLETYIKRTETDLL